MRLMRNVCDGKIQWQCSWGKGEFITEGTAKGLGIQTGKRLEEHETLAFSDELEKAL